MPNISPEGLFKTLASVALADGPLTPEERTALDRLAARLGLAAPDATRWLAEVQADPERAISFPEDPEDAVELLEGMVHVATADGVIQPAERTLIERLREQLGIDVARFESLVTYHLSRVASGAGTHAPAVGAEVAKEHFRVLAAVAFADREIADEELELLDRMRRRLGLDEGAAEGVIDAIKADRKALEKLDLSKVANKDALFEDVVKIAAADGVLHAAERKLLERVRHALGVDEKRLESLLAYALPVQAPTTEGPSALLVAVVVAAVLGVAVLVLALSR